jgi:protein KTI12
LGCCDDGGEERADGGGCSGKSTSRSARYRDIKFVADALAFVMLQATKPPPDALQVLTKTTSSLLSALQTHLALNPSPSPAFPLLTTGSSTSKSKSKSSGEKFLIHLPPRAVSPSELQRLKRQFEGIQKRALVSGGTGAREGTWTEEAISERFARYLMECWGSSIH